MMSSGDINTKDLKGNKSKCLGLKMPADEVFLWKGLGIKRQIVVSRSIARRIQKERKQYVHQQLRTNVDEAQCEVLERNIDRFP